MAVATGLVEDSLISARNVLSLKENLERSKLDAAPADVSSSSTQPSVRRAKIICTIGPACNTEAMLRDLMRLGMDVARLNFSHGTHAEHTRNIDRKSTRLNSSHQI